MKKLISLISVVVLTLTLSACQDYAANTVECKPEVVEVEVCTGGETETGDDEHTEEPAAAPSGEFHFKHINGEGEMKDANAQILFEFKSLKSTKYQIAYISCTWRPQQYHFKQVAYVELKKDGTIKDLAFDKVYDTSYGGTVTPGMWGDSNPTPEGMTKDQFIEEIVEGYLIGKTVEDLADYTLMKDSLTSADIPTIDQYAGSSVSVNNLFSVLKGLQDYHLNK